MPEYELYHYGVKGMKWGIRRYQNADGSLTPAGQKRYDQQNDLYDRALLRKRDAANIRKRAEGSRVLGLVKMKLRSDARQCEREANRILRKLGDKTISRIRAEREAELAKLGIKSKGEMTKEGIEFKAEMTRRDIERKAWEKAHDEAFEKRLQYWLKALEDGTEEG